VVQGVRIPNTHAPGTWGNPISLPRLLVARRSDNLWKDFVSVTNYLLIRCLFRIPLLDFQNVTIFPTRLAKSINFETHSSFTGAELLFNAYWQGATIAQVRVDFIRRKRGVSHGTRWRSIVAAVLQIVYFWFKWEVLGLRLHKGKGVIVTQVGDRCSTDILGGRSLNASGPGWYASRLRDVYGLDGGMDKPAQ